MASCGEPRVARVDLGIADADGRRGSAYAAEGHILDGELREAIAANDHAPRRIGDRDARCYGVALDRGGDLIRDMYRLGTAGQLSRRTGRIVQAGGDGDRA